MRLHFATEPIFDGQDDKEVFNRILGSHRVIGIERHVTTHVRD